jgi:F-type H+-transporting ATPase subunit beta
MLSLVFDVFGRPLHRGPPLADVEWRTVHVIWPLLAVCATTSEDFATGTKIIDVP